MRSVSSSALSASLQNARIVSSRLVVTDNRLRFSSLNKSFSSSLLSGLKSYDAATKSSSVYEVANVNNVLWYRYISSPGGSWPGWTNSGRALKANSRPGLYQNRVFYQESGGSAKYSDINGSSLGGANSYSGFPISGILSFAPLSNTRCVVRDVPSATSTYAKIMQTNPAAYMWSGRLYGNTDLSLEVFDAETDENGWTYVFWGEETGRVKYSTYLRAYEPWSTPLDLIPMDVVDDLNQFALGGVTRLGSVGDATYWPLEGSLWVGGALARTDMGNMQMYTMGPPWSHGREIFVGTDGATDPVWGGKMHFIGSNVYYIGPNSAYSAPGRDWTGDSSPSTTIYDISTVNYQQEQNNSAKLIAEIPYSISNSALRQGSDITWYAQIQQEGGSVYDVKMGVFNIDMILESLDTSSRAKTLVARSRSAKALQMWKPDTSFDYWGSDARVGDPAELSELIRLDGHWSGESGYLVNEKLNEVGTTINGEKLGLMYSTARPSRGMIVKEKFKFDNDANFKPLLGIALNYYVESKEAAANRYGVSDPNSISWLDYGRNYILFGWGKEEHSGSPGWSVKNVEDSNWTLYGNLSTGPLSLSANTWYWFMAQMREGEIFFYYRPDSSTTWTLLYHSVFEQPNDPWFSTSAKGRGALFSHNETSWVPNTPFNSSSDFLPFMSKTAWVGGATLPTSAIYRVDEELFNISNILGNASAIQQNEMHRECGLFPSDNQPIPEPAFTPPANSYPIWGEFLSYGVPTAANGYNDMLVVITDGPGTGNVYEVAANGWNHEAPTQWVPTPSIYNPTDPNWMDHIGEGGAGTWGDRVSRIYVTEDPRGAVRVGSKWKIVYKGVGTRGYGGTLVASHPGTGNDYKVQLESTARSHFSEFHAFTDEKEWNMEMMLTEIARKAGVRNVSTKKHLNGSYTNSGGWALNSQMSSYGTKMASFVVRARNLSTSGKVGVQFDRTPSWSGGYVCYVQAGTPSYAVLMESDGTILETVSFGNSTYPTDGWYEFSVQGKHVKVYRQGGLCAAFKLPTEVDTQSYSGPAFSGCTARYDWPELAMRVDNFIMDIGQKGSMLVNRLIGQKRIYWQDDQNGDLRLYRDKVTVNSGSPYVLTLVSGNTYDETSIATRVRVEGADAAMAIDEDALYEHGNIFMVANSEDVTNAQDALVEAEWILDELKKRSTQYSFRGACDPRVEAGDIIETTLDGETKYVAVDSVKIIMAINEREARFDMNIEGHNAYA